MGVAQVAIERLDGVELNIVGIGADLQLQRSSIDVPTWVPIGVRVPTATQGLLSRVWFCDLDAPRASGEPMDIVVPDDRGNPLVAIDPTLSATPVLTRLPSNGSFAVNLQQSLAGHFSSQRTSFVTYGVLSQRMPNFERIRRSDLSGFIRSYEPFDSALITYRYPMPVQPEAGFTTPVGMNVVAGERVEIAMDIAAGGGVRSFERIVELGTSANGPWTIDERATHALGGGHVETARFVFDECRTGFWRVTLAPLDPAVDVSLLPPSRLSFAPWDLATTDDAASWIFNVTASPVPLRCTKGGGPFPLCGNGVVEGAEACDDGNVVDGDFCTAVCTVPRCGDGHVSSGETCDDGNTLDGDACPATCTTSMCGNGVVEPGEQCDDGANFPSCYGAGTCAMCLYCLE